MVEMIGSLRSRITVQRDRSDPNDTSGTARRSVKTGDDTPIGVWVGILAAAIIVGGGAAYGVKRKKKK